MTQAPAAVRLTPGGCLDCGAEIVNQAVRGRWRTRCDQHHAERRSAIDRARRAPADIPVSTAIATSSVSTASVAETAWLAGLWDGEGSVGVSFDRPNGRLLLSPQIQISMTHLPTIKRAIEVLGKIGIHAIHHTVQEKSTHHKDSYHAGFGRTVLVVLAANALLPHSVTKREHWEIMRELCLLRIERQGVTANGTLRRGGPPGSARPYSDREMELAGQLRSLNYRAKPGDIA